MRDLRDLRQGPLAVALVLGLSEVKGLWMKLKSAAKKVVSGMRRAKENIFGAPQASDAVKGWAQVSPMPPRRSERAWSNGSRATSRRPRPVSCRSLWPGTRAQGVNGRCEATEEDTYERQVHAPGPFG